MPEQNIPKFTYKDLRSMFAANDSKRDENLLPPDDVFRMTDQDYALDGCPEHTLDVYYPVGTEGPLPVILNVHGGGWTYGSKGIYQYYCMSLAQNGFTVVNMNYRLAPESRFPAQLEDVFTAISYILERKERYHCDMDHLFLVGDSAGAQLVSQICTLITNPAYRSLFDLEIPEISVKGALMNCGVYDVKNSFFDEEGNQLGMDANYLPVDAQKEQILKQMDVLGYITEDFPPSCLMGSVNDTISITDTDAFGEFLKSKGVNVLSLWFGQDDPQLGHVFHINISLEAARECNEREIDFLRTLL